ncbi:phosphatase [Streptomyces sp. NPDC096012]|uniref:phosphatase n=1 Tax=Streptomyces sp. NPDC096012 TaxID=3155684 RepID=UPI00336ADFDC
MAAAGAGGALPELVVGDHGRSAAQVGWHSVPSAWPMRTALRSCWGYRGPTSVVVPLGDAVRSDYYRPLTRYVLNRAVCHSRRPMGVPLPHSHRPSLHWGVSMQRK